MSSEQEKDMRVAAAIVQAGCWILDAGRTEFFYPKQHVCEIHAAAMEEAMITLQLPRSARRELLADRTYSSMGRCPFFRALVEFYIEQGRKEAGK